MTELLEPRNLLGPLLDPSRRVFWPFLLGALVLCIVVWKRAGRPLRALPGFLFPRSIWLHPSAVLDYQLLLLRGLAKLLGLGGLGLSAWAVAVGLVRWLDGAFGLQQVDGVPLALAGAAYTAALFVASDASRYLVHRLLHAVPALWQIHQVHHSAEVMTPLTFYRAHPLESALYFLRSALVTKALASPTPTM